MRRANERAEGETARFCIGVRQKWLRRRAMARRTASFRLSAKPDLGFCWLRDSRRRGAPPIPCHNDRPRPLSANSDAKISSEKDGDQRSPNAAHRPAEHRRASSAPLPVRHCSQRHASPPRRCNRHPRARRRPAAAATAVTAFESSKGWCAVETACSSNLDARHAAACPALWQGRQQLDRAPFCRTPGVS